VAVALAKTPASAASTDRASTIDLLRSMLLIRAFEERLEKLYEERALKGTAHSSVGQEATAVGACRGLSPGDFVLSHHRGHGHCLAMGASPGRMMAELLGRHDGYCGGHGGSMHIADTASGLVGANGIVGAGLGLGVGVALAARMDGLGRVGIAFFGDGASNEGIFHEALNMASIWRLPLIFVCENNGYGLSTPAASVIAGGGIARRGVAYDIPGILVDGNDVVAVRDAVRAARDRAAAGDGPTLIEATTYRWGDHNMRPSWPGYRDADEERSWREGDPILRFEATLQSASERNGEELLNLREQATAVVDQAVTWAKGSPDPEVAGLAGSVLVPIATFAEPALPHGERRLSYAEAINEALAQEMERDETVFLIGEDIARIGGIYGTTRGLLDRFGPDRVLDAPISEAAIAGAAIGAAIAGRRPVVEIQIFDFVTHMMDMIVNQAAKFRFMLGGQGKVPVVFRGPQGGGLRLAAQHSQSLEAWFAHVPGLIVLAPSSPHDAKGLMTSAIRDDNPCIFIEHKLLYLAQPQPVPPEPYAIPIGVAAVKRIGQHLTIIAISAMVPLALKAAEELAGDGISAEVLDPRTLRPLDWNTIIASVVKTSRCLVVHEAWRTGGLGAEIAAEIGERAFDWLDAPVTRLCGMDVPAPFSPVLERATIPDAKAITRKARELVGTIA
jgi:2-oxoisovalerate dehydrogenase E1 component